LIKIFGQKYGSIYLPVESTMVTNRQWTGVILSNKRFPYRCCLLYSALQALGYVKSFQTQHSIRRRRCHVSSLQSGSSTEANLLALNSGQGLNQSDNFTTYSVRSRSFFPIYYNDVYEVKLPPNHRFPMEKYRKVRDIVQNAILSLKDDSRVHCEFRVSPVASVSELLTTHSEQYVQRFMNGDLTEEEIRNVGFPWSPSGVDRARSSVGGTVAAAVAVCQELQQRSNAKSSSGPYDSERIDKTCCWGAHVAGGTHHAFFDRGEGFCVFSDIAVATNVILDRFPDLVKRVLIVDLDVHQGNGNAVLFQGRDDVFTFSMHCSANYFSDKQTSDLDIELPPDCNDETYLATLSHWLKQIQKNAGRFDFIFYQAGVDVLFHDRLGRMNISADGIKRRDTLIYNYAANILKIPMVITMGGGYPRSGSDWAPILDAHANVYIQAYNFLAGME
jgi:acetoin utilization deacetylase AcuC-like enzyme